MHRVILIFFVVFFGHVRILMAQEMLGTTLGNYAGADGLQLNPSSMLGSKQWLDIRLTGLNLSLQNNYLFLSKSEFVIWDFFKADYNLPSHEEDYGTEVRNFYSYTNDRRKNVFLQARVNGPGAMVIWGDHAFALNTGFRSVTSIRKLPVDLANFLYLGLNYKPQQDIEYQNDKKYSMTQMTWFEIGLSYAYTVYGRGFDRLDAGISIRKLFGIAGMYVLIHNMDYMVMDDSTLQINNLDADYGFSLPVDYTAHGMTFQSNPLISGGGWGVDLGVTYTRLTCTYQKQYIDRLCEQSYADYTYRLGISMIDIGGIAFNNRAQTYGVDNRSAYWEHLNRYAFQSIDQLMDTISEQFYGNPDATVQKDRFTLWLPSALGIQFDYHYHANWYVNAALVLPFQTGKISLYRPALLAVTPRYESYWFEANLPVSFYDWYQLRLGLSLRFFFLTIGTEKLGSFFGLSNFNGLDLYLSIKLPLEKGRCRKSGKDYCPAYDNFSPIKF